MPMALSPSYPKGSPVRDLRALSRYWVCGLAWLLPACAPYVSSGSPVSPVSPEPHVAGGTDGKPHALAPCQAGPAQGAVGQTVTPQRAEAARQQAGARTVRVIGHGDIITKEYDSGRLNLQLDVGGRVVRVYCG